MTHHPIRDLPINAYCGEREWQDIITAPKDGTPIVAIIWFSRSFDGPKMFAEYAVLLWDELEDSGWLDQEGNPSECSPTHWMPLPAPPAIEQTGPVNPECRNPDGCDRSHRMPSCRECSTAWLTLEPSERMRRRQEARAA